MHLSQDLGHEKGSILCHSFRARRGQSSTLFSILTHRPDLVNRQVRTVILFLLAQAQPGDHLNRAIHQETAQERHHDTGRGAKQLADEADSAQTAQCCLPKIPHATPPQTPHSPCSGQTPRTSSIFQRTCAAVKHQTNNAPAISR